MQARGPFSSADVDATRREVAARLQAWGLPPGPATLWTSSAAASVVEDGDWELELDRDLGLVSFEVWAGGRRVFGIDDFLGPT